MSNAIVSERKFEFTKSNLDKLPIPEKRYEVRDTKITGLRVEVHPSGKKTCRVVRRVRGTNKTAKVTLGLWGDFKNADRLRTAAENELARINQGVDITKERKEKRKTEADELLVTGLTIYDLYDDWADGCGHAAHTRLCYDGLLRNHLKSVADKPLTEWLHWDGLYKLRDSIKTASTAKNSMKIVYGVLEHARGRYRPQRHLLPVWPFETKTEKANFEKPMKTSPRESMLPIDEPAKFHKWLECLDMLPVLFSNRKPDGDLWRDYFKFLLFTGCRREEAKRNLLWENIDFKGRSFVVPITKTNVPLHMPFTTVTEAILIDVWNRAGNPKTGRVFPLGHPDDILKEIEAYTGIKHSLHDLRRTFSTAADLAGVNFMAIKTLMNHSKPGGDTTLNYMQSHKLSFLRDPAQQITDYLVAI